MMKSPKLMFIYAAFLLMCGVVAFALAHFEWKAKTALIVSGATAALMIICGLMAQATHRQKVIGMIGIHLGMVLPLVFAAAFAFQAWKSWQKYQLGERHLYLPVIVAIMSIGSVVAFIAILKTRPPKSMRGA